MKPLTLSALVLVALASGACRQGTSPVAEVDIRPSQIQLAWPEYREIEIVVRPLAALPKGVTRPTVFLHLLDEPGSVVRTFDHPLPEDWKPGRTIRYRVPIYQSALAEPLAPGRYLLSIGIYGSAGRRFPLKTTGPAIARQEYQVATVDVPQARDDGPQAHFSETWMPPEAGTDRQVLVRRTLRGGAPGTIQFGPVTGPGRILVGVLVPWSSTSEARLELDPGATQPKVRVASSCASEQAEVTGSGEFDLDLTVPADASHVTCELTVEPNFKLTTRGRTESTSARLELLAWSPGPVEKTTD